MAVTNSPLLQEEGSVKREWSVQRAKAAMMLICFWKRRKTIEPWRER